MIIINGQAYYYNGFEHVPAGMTEAEYFSQFTSQSERTGNKKSLNDIVE
uniref:Uncharacterized protein n=1 Tax=Siphoviridae sp. ctTnV63 TaxID=2825523 RepID=A0A8S5NWH6_9CAUD|nr:MAG TPA: hypothetical protein [Siphoviridae sp. ctTnV63]